ncbi:MAG: Pr6Pr family membrane protein [Actinomycetales bacterium]|nr:Pr6Pr family membrane protein [Actinomycetales bacterium]
MRVLFVVLRVLAAAAIAAAIVGQLQRSLTFETDTPGWSAGLVLSNFFSFFTIDSNTLSVVTLLIGAGLLLAGRRVDPRWFALLRVSTTTYMVVTGIVYNTLLRGIPLPQGQTVEWSNEILHVAGPILLLLDWLFAPGRARLEWRAIGVIVAFPIVWAIYTLVRGAIFVDPITGTNWYPYPFLNPELSPLGYVSVAFYVVLIAAIIGLVGAGAIWISRRGARTA